MHKIVNLDDSKNTLELSVEGRAFTITRIVLKANQLYGEYCLETAKYLEFLRTSQEIAPSATAEEVQAMRFELDERLLKYADYKATVIEQIMEVILTKNGYEFDKAWWYENTDYGTMESFIYEAMTKDSAPAASKKKITK